MTAYEQGFFTKCAEYGIPVRAASDMFKQASRVSARFRHIKEWLTGARLKRLRARRSSLLKYLEGLKDETMSAERKYIDLNNSDPLRHVTLTQGKTHPGTYDIRTDLSYLDLSGAAKADAEGVHKGLKPLIDAAEDKYDTLLNRYYRVQDRCFHDFYSPSLNPRGGLLDMVNSEAKAVRKARLIAGAAGALGIGGAGATTAAVVHKKKKR